MRSFCLSTIFGLLTLMFFLVVALPQPAPAGTLRIVCLNSNALEALRVLQAHREVVGVTRHTLLDSAFWQELQAVPDMGDWREPDYEAIAALRPDFVVCYRDNPGSEAERLLAPFGIRVVRLDLYRMDTFEEELQKLAALIGRQEHAAEFLHWYRTHMSRLRAVVAASPIRPAAYLEAFTDFRAAGNRSGFGTLCEAAGLRNIGASIDHETALVTTEWIAAQQPSLVVKNIPRTGDYARKDASRLLATCDALASRNGWSLIKGVREGNILSISSAITGGPAAVVGMAHLVKHVHGDAAQAIDPDALHREYLTRFQGIPFSGYYFVAQEGRP